jgi:hypothetical protein
MRGNELRATLDGWRAASGSRGLPGDGLGSHSRAYVADADRHCRAVSNRILRITSQTTGRGDWLREGGFSIAYDLGGQTVVVLDDVVNTRSTIGALADAAWAAGPARVVQLAFAPNQSP